MKGAQDVRKERENQREIERLEEAENVEIMESLILERFKEIETSTVVIWEYKGFFVVPDDLTHIPLSRNCESVLYKEFNSEEGFSAEFIKMFNDKKGISIRIID